MGLNLSIEKVTRIGSGCAYATEDQEWFDYTRHAGDSDFAVQILYNASEELDENSGLFRPKDFDKTLAWIDDRIETQGNRNRLTEAVNKLKEDKDLYFKISW